jgi:hypothetical protein
MEITEFLKGSLNVLYFVNFNNVQITIAAMTPIIGKKAVKKSLKITVDFVNNVKLLFSKNQSNDKNDSEEVPTRSTM